VILTSVISGIENQSRHESRSQRFFLCELKSWGDAPGYDDIAPLALNRNETERRVNNLIIPSAGAIKVRILFMDER
jgi:hypothetical protein